MNKKEAIEKLTANPETVERIEKRGLTVEQVADKLVTNTYEDANDFIWKAWFIGKSLESDE